MADNGRISLPPKQKPWMIIVLALIASPGIFSTVATIFSTAAERADKASRNAETVLGVLKKQVEFTDMQIATLKQEIAQLRNMNFEIMLRLSDRSYDEAKEARKEKESNRRRGADKPVVGMAAGASSGAGLSGDSLDDLFSPEKNMKPKAAPQAALQRPLFPESL